MNKPAFFPIQSLTFDPDLQIRVRINEETIAIYAEQMTTEDEMKAFPAVEIYYDGAKYWLADGHHRRAAAEKAGHDKVWAIVKNGTRADALWGAILGNGKQGFGLTPEDRRRTIMLVIQQWPDKSNRVIAEAVGCSHATVQRCRPSTGTNVPVEEERRTGKDGKSRPAKQKSTSKKANKTQESTESSQQKTTSDTTEQQTEFRPGSWPTKKYVGETELKPIPRDRPDILVGNLIAFFPQEFIPNTAREIFRMLHDRYGAEITKPLAIEFYQQYGRGKK